MSGLDPTAYQRAWNLVRVIVPCPRRPKTCKPPRMCRLCAEAVRAIKREIERAYAAGKESVS